MSPPAARKRSTPTRPRGAFRRTTRARAVPPTAVAFDRVRPSESSSPPRRLRRAARQATVAIAHEAHGFAVAPASAQPGRGGAPTFPRSARSGDFRGGRLILHGVARRVQATTTDGRTEPVSLMPLPARLFAPGKPGTQADPIALLQRLRELTGKGVRRAIAMDESRQRRGSNMRLGVRCRVEAGAILVADRP
jgi:hypothetical protein